MPILNTLNSVKLGSLEVSKMYLGSSLTYPTAAPAVPTVSYNSTGKFNITNYDSDLIYTATLVSGSGTATLADGVYTLSAVTSRFSIIASRTEGSPASAAAFVERKPVATYQQPYTGTCTSTSTNWCACGCECGGGGCGCYPGPTGQSFGQCGCPGTMCWYGGMCTSTSTYACTQYNTVEYDYTSSGYVRAASEWYKLT